MIRKKTFFRHRLTMPSVTKSRKDTFFMTNDQHDLLAELLWAQDRDNEVVSYPAAESYSRQIIRLAKNFSDPILVPVGSGGERLIGCVSFLSEGSIEAPLWYDTVGGRDVLLVGTVAGSMVEFDALAMSLRRRGAHSVHGCAMEVINGSGSAALESFTILRAVRQAARQTA